MNTSLLLIVRSGTDRRMHVGEAVDLALVCGAFGMEVSVMFESEGLVYLRTPLFSDILSSAEPDDFAHLFASGTPQGSVREDIEWLSTQQLKLVLNAHQHTVVV